MITTKGGEGDYSVVVAEDHTLLREGLKSLLQSMAGICVVGEASDGQNAIEMCEEHEPDLVIMDVSMPRMDGLKATRIVKKKFPHIKILVLTVHSASEYVYSAFTAGADGYVLKDATNEEFALAIESVLKGRSYLSPGVSGDVIRGYLSGSPAPEGGSAWASLTPREEEIFQLVAEGYKNREIADMLVVSVKTVEKHRSNLMQKLGIHSGAELKALAEERGILPRRRED